MSTSYKRQQEDFCDEVDSNDPFLQLRILKIKETAHLLFLSKEHRFISRPTIAPEAYFSLFLISIAAFHYTINFPTSLLWVRNFDKLNQRSGAICQTTKASYLWSTLQYVQHNQFIFVFILGTLIGLDKVCFRAGREIMRQRGVI